MIDTGAFIQRLTRTKSLPLKVVHSLADGLRVNRFDAQETFLSPGNYAAAIYFVQSGLIRGAIEGPFGKTTTWFKQESDLLIPQGLFNQQASDEYLSAVSNTILLSLPLKHLQKVAEGSSELTELVIMLMAESLQEGQYREKLLRIPAARGRYEFIAKNESYILRRIPHHMIASYLNMTKETFSRIHKGLAY